MTRGARRGEWLRSGAWLSALLLCVPACARARSAEPDALVVDCTAPTRPISPGIYGVGDSGRTRAGDATAWELGATAHRWGGNSTSRYNWEKNAWNTGSDWYFHNVQFGSGPGAAWERFLDANAAHGITSAITLPTIGWVAKDTTSMSFPRTRFPAQHAFAPEDAAAGDGLGADGKPLRADPTLTSIPAPPEFDARWVQAIRARAAEGHGGARLYFLDNEPTLWHETHRDVHPEPVSFDELLDRTLRYAKAVRAADPHALIAGPSLWGWPDLFDSGKDAVISHRLHPDRLAHGNTALLEWWLTRVRAEEKRTGQTLIDVVDVHAYPQHESLKIGRDGATDPATSALRLRATRMLWDPDYVDESWIAEKVELIPRLRRWIDAHAPGKQLSIGEWNFGAENHISGGLAVAEALGRFAQTGVDWAFYWTAPPPQSPAFWAFRAYRNYDGQGGHFGDTLLRSHAPEGVSLFASREGRDGTVVLVALNLDPGKARTLPLELRGCHVGAEARRFDYAGGAAGLVPSAARSSGSVTLAPFSMTVLEVPAQK